MQSNAIMCTYCINDSHGTVPRFKLLTHTHTEIAHCCKVTNKQWHHGMVF